MRGKTQAVGELLEPRQGRVRARSKALDVSNLDLHSDQKVPKNRSGVSFNRGHEVLSILPVRAGPVIKEIWLVVAFRLRK